MYIKSLATAVALASALLMITACGIQTASQLQADVTQSDCGAAPKGIHVFTCHDPDGIYTAKPAYYQIKIENNSLTIKNVNSLKEKGDFTEDHAEFFPYETASKFARTSCRFHSIDRLTQKYTYKVPQALFEKATTGTVTMYDDGGERGLLLKLKCKKN